MLPEKNRHTIDTARNKPKSNLYQAIQDSRRTGSYTQIDKTLRLILENNLTNDHCKKSKLSLPADTEWATSNYDWLVTVADSQLTLYQVSTQTVRWTMALPQHIPNSCTKLLVNSSGMILFVSKFNNGFCNIQIYKEKKLLNQFQMDENFETGSIALFDNDKIVFASSNSERKYTDFFIWSQATGLECTTLDFQLPYNIILNSNDRYYFLISRDTDKQESAVLIDIDRDKDKDNNNDNKNAEIQKIILPYANSISATTLYEDELIYNAYDDKELFAKKCIFVFDLRKKQLTVKYYLPTNSDIKHISANQDFMVFQTLTFASSDLYCITRHDMNSDQNNKTNALEEKKPDHNLIKLLSDENRKCFATFFSQNYLIVLHATSKAMNMDPITHMKYVIDLAQAKIIRLDEYDAYRGEVVNFTDGKLLMHLVGAIDDDDYEQPNASYIEDYNFFSTRSSQEKDSKDETLMEDEPEAEPSLRHKPFT